MMAGSEKATSSGLATSTERTRVVILGAGPAGLLLSHLLHRAGVESVVVEARDREYVQARVRAGVVEHGTADILREAGVGDRLDREGLPHGGIELRFDGEGHRIPMSDLTGRHITVYGQQKVVHDLTEQRLADGGDVRFACGPARIHDVDTAEPSVTYTLDGEEHRVVADFVVGCDGAHGSGRTAMGPAMSALEKEYPFAWLGILAHASPRVDELVYASHERGFALYSMRSTEMTRLYLQVPSSDRLEDWPDDRIWEELSVRFSLGGEPWSPTRGEIFERSLAPLHSFVAEPMQRGRLFLAGDAAHIVPPTGAKGMNLAIRDVALLAPAMAKQLTDGDESDLRTYSERALQDVWRAEYFSWWMTTMLHRFEGTAFDRRVQTAQLRSVVSSRAHSTALAEAYVG
ncbi:4-hydroxybenzoate 3-monooxygenase [Georgenia halophila]|uniref:4-hydroxybenzoate 3-monooxygenase n=1 Tax=Georgenia halophila TaxID=620889 RepID=A0ABP8L9E0_9MICO